MKRTRFTPAARRANAAACALAIAVTLGATGSRAATNPQEMAGMPAEAAAPAAAATPDARATYMALIRELQAQGQSYAALAHVAQYEARWGAAPETQVLRADALRATGQDAAAATAYRQLLDGPRAAAAHRGLGLMEAAGGRWPAAIDQLAAAARLDPTDAATLSDLGYARLRAGRLTEARVPLMTAAQLRPTDSRVLANLASYFMAAGQAEQAEAVLRSPHVSESARAMLRGRPAAAPNAGAAAAAQPVIPAMKPVDAVAIADTPAPALRLEPSLATGSTARGDRPFANLQGATR